MKSVTINTLTAAKHAGEKFPVLTAYDASFSRLAELAHIDVLLVGDSLGNVIQGKTSTVPVTVDDMVYHTQSVCRGNHKSFIIADLPFMSYTTPQQALDNATRLMQAGAHMVKVEGGAWLAESIKQLTTCGVPVCGHLGLTPQSVSKLGGYRVQGKDEDSAQQIIADAKALQQAGAELLVLECVPSWLGKEITEQLEIPVIGIGAGPDTDAQVLVVYDILGLSPRQPKFSQNFLTGQEGIQQAMEAFATAVRSGAFPQSEHGFK